MGRIVCVSVSKEVFDIDLCSISFLGQIRV